MRKPRKAGPPWLPASIQPDGMGPQELENASLEFDTRVQIVSRPPDFSDQSFLSQLQAARRRTSQTVAAIRIKDSASSQPPSIHWNVQKRLAG